MFFVLSTVISETQFAAATELENTYLLHPLNEKQYNDNMMLGKKREIEGVRVSEKKEKTEFELTIQCSGHYLEFRSAERMSVRASR